MASRTYKQPVVASRAVVAANHPLTAAAGMQMLAAGGSVADAAVAAAFAASVVEPMMVGIFGAGYVLVRDAATGRCVVLDNYSPAPRAARADMYTPDDQSGPMATVGQQNRIGYTAAAVPGALLGWCRLHALMGRLPLPAVLGPAIQYAEYGFPASEYLVHWIRTERENLARFPTSAAIYLPGGEVPSVGTLIRNPDCAETLRMIAREGPDVLYHGPLGDRLVQAVQEGGGLLTREDLETYAVLEREPVRGTYRGYEIVGVPLPSAGGILVQEGLNILEGFDLRALGFGTARYWHLVLEVLKVLFADRARYLGDPAFVDVPVDRLVDKGYAAERRQSLPLDRASPASTAGPPSVEPGHTTHITVMDTDGNVVAMTQTLMEIFGCRAVIPGTGCFLNNTMALFDPHPGRPNSIAPGKRMLTSTAATIVLRDGRPTFALGTPGGERIFPAVLQVILNVIDNGMMLQEAVEAPRVFANGRVVEVEADAPAAVVEELRALGHAVSVVVNVAGGMNGVQVGADGLLYGAACWRADGSPVGLSGGPARPGAYSP